MIESAVPIPPPLLSVVVPVHQGAWHLRAALEAIRSSDLPSGRWELIVVDDASGDASAEIAAASADLVIRLRDRPRGPAYARNRGFEAARGTCVAFIDADVVVGRSALARMLAALSEDESIGAVVGTYDASRSTGHLLSDYRNLLRHFEHRRNGGDTDTFAAGLCLVRREAFVRAGMFDEWRFPRPQAEALEFGDRLMALGYRIVRRVDAAAAHLKTWTLLDWIRLDLLDRGMAIARLDQHKEFRTRAARLYRTTPIDGVLAWTSISTAVIAIWKGQETLAVVSVASFLLLSIRHTWLFAGFYRARGLALATAAVPIHFLTCAAYGLASAVGRAMYYAIGEPQPDPVTQAFAEVGVRTWPPVPAPPPSANGSYQRPKATAAVES